MHAFCVGQLLSGPSIFGSGKYTWWAIAITCFHVCVKVVCRELCMAYQTSLFTFCIVWPWKRFRHQGISEIMGLDVTTQPKNHKNSCLKYRGRKFNLRRFLPQVSNLTELLPAVGYKGCQVSSHVSTHPWKSRSVCPVTDILLSFLIGMRKQYVNSIRFSCTSWSSSSFIRNLHSLIKF